MLRGAEGERADRGEVAEENDAEEREGSERTRERERIELPGRRRERMDGEVAKGANNCGWTNKPMDPKPRRDSDCLKIKSASNYDRVRPLEPLWTPG